MIADAASERMARRDMVMPFFDDAAVWTLATQWAAIWFQA
jgi:hypothetical protein